MTRWTVEEKRLSTYGGQYSWQGLGEVQANVPASADFNSPGIDALYFDMGAIEVEWSGTDNAGTVSIEGSIGGHWCEVAGLGFSTTAGSGHELIGFPDFEFRQYRIKYIAGSTTTGNINARYLLKSRI